MRQQLPQMGRLAQPYSQIGLAGSSILSGCHHSDVSPAVCPLAFGNLYPVSPLTITVAPGGVVRWLHHYTDPYAPTMDLNNVSSTLMSSWIVPVPFSHGMQWFYHAYFRGCGHDTQPLVTALAGIITIPHDDPAPEPTEPGAFRTMLQWQHDPDLPQNEFDLQALDANLSESQPADHDSSGYIGIWQVPYTAETGTKWRYHCRFHDTTGSGRIASMRIEGVVVVAYPTAGLQPDAEQYCRRRAMLARMAS